MTEEKNLYLPLFYNTLELTSSLSDAEFGVLVRTLLKGRANPEYTTNLPIHLQMAYNFMLDSATRVFCAQFKRTEAINAKKEKGSNFDVDDAFQKALVRTYGE